MKTKIIILLVALFALSGCVTQNAAKKFSAFEALGITEAQITGKFSNTEYRVTREDGVRKAELEHSNAWLTKVRLVRVTEDKKP